MTRKSHAKFSINSYDDLLVEKVQGTPRCVLYFVNYTYLQSGPSPGNPNDSRRRCWLLLPALSAQLALPQLLQIPEVDKQTKQLPRLLF